VNLAYYRTLSFGIASFYAGIGGALYAHYLLFVSVEAFNILFSIQFLAMVIIGGLGSISGSLMGAAFMVLLPEAVQTAADALAGGAVDRALRLGTSISFLREMAIGAAIILFLIFEPDGLAHRWRQIKAYWKLYPYSH
jgi:branched-chain amino acid transport system permease protein